MNSHSKRGSRSQLARHLLQITAFVLFGLGNPLYLVACSDSGSSGDTYEYHQADMLAVASGLEAEGPYSVGEYSISVQFPFGSETAATKNRTDPLAPSYFTRAHACGTRSFVAPAAACIDSSELRLEGTLRVQRAAEVVELPITGTMRVDSRILTFAHFEFIADSLRLSFTWDDAEGYRYEPIGTNDAAELAALFASN